MVLFLYIYGYITINLWFNYNTLWIYYNESMDLLQYIYGLFTIHLWFYYNKSMVLLQYIYGFITMNLWFYYNTFMDLLQ